MEKENKSEDEQEVRWPHPRNDPDKEPSEPWARLSQGKDEEEDENEGS